MKDLSWIIGLCVLVGPQAFAQSTAPVPDPTCGFIAGPHEYREARDVQQGLSVDLVVGQPQIGQPITLRFFVNEKPRNLPVGTLQVEHEKLMHVIGVRDDLTEFFHVHPIKVGPGAWEVSHTFERGGIYKLWTDIKYRGISYSFGQPLVPVSGSIGETVKPRLSIQTQTNSGYRVSFDHPAPLPLASTNRLQFSIRDADGLPVETENFLGAPMHLVIIKDDLSVYVHAHPEIRSGGDPVISFSQWLPKAGTYKLFAQFRPRGRKLPPDEAILVEFWMGVAPEPVGLKTSKR